MTQEQLSILMIEDHAEIAEILSYHLVKAGFKVEIASDGEEGLNIARLKVPSIILLDLMLPKLHGLEVARAIRVYEKTAHIPIIMLTAMGDEADIVKGLEMGADDYLVKPVKAAELVARIKALWRRAGQNQNSVSSHEINVDGLVLDKERHVVTLLGKSISMTLTEFQILSCLIEGAGRIYTRDQLIDRVRGHDIAIVDRNIDVHISSLRKKLKDHGRRIFTVRGVGYRFLES
ncbi:MAG: response regulator [Bdellovibrionales bacterium]|nr:response regulator [Bdellovibrionales bacterium]